MPLPRICFLGLDNLPVLSRDYNQHGIGGEPVQQTLIARALARRGFTVSMVVADLGQPDPLVVDGVTALRAYRPAAGVPVLRFIHPRWTGVMSALERADADVYYTSCASIGVAQIALVARRLGRRSVFRTASDSDCDPRKLLLRLWRDKRIYEWGLRRVDAVLTQSTFQQRLCAENYAISSRVAGMLVETGNPDTPFAARAHHALWVSNLRQLKRPDLFLDLARALPAIQCHMVGGPQPDSAQLFADTAAAAASLPNLHFAGQVPYHDVTAIYENARVLVNTSDMEGFPNTYLQAWAHGVPVVAYFDPDGVIAREGLGIAAADPTQMRDAVRRLSQDEGAWHEASARCRRYMQAHFSEDRVLAPYFAAFGTTAVGAVQP